MSSFVQHKKFFLDKPAIIFAGILLSALVGVTAAQQVSAAGATYYVNNQHPNCNDAYSTAQNSASTPWCTITAANQKHGAADTVMIYPGVYRQTISPKAGLSNTQRTVYTGSTGNAADVKIVGSDVVTGWQQYSGNIYRASFEAGDQCRIGGSETVTVKNTNCWVDGQTWLKRGAHTNTGDALSDLNAAGEFFYDQSSKQVYVWMPQSDNPASHLIECSKRKAFEGGGQYSSVPEVNNFTLQHVTITQTNGRGITFNSNPHRPGNITIQDNILSYTTGDGYCAGNPAAIYHGNSNDYTPDIPNIDILRNDINNVGSDRGGINDSRIYNVHSGVGIEFYTVRDSLIEGNTFWNMFEAIGMKTADVGIHIKNNFIHDVGQGIWIGPPSRVYLGENAPINTELTALIEGNLIYNVQKEGHQAAMYISNGNTRVNMYNNTMVNSNGITVVTDNMSDNPYRKNETYLNFRNNIIHELWSEYTMHELRFLTFRWNSIVTSTSDYNVYNSTTHAAANFGGSWTGGTYGSYISSTLYPTLTNWQSATGKDANSIMANPLFVNASGNDFQLQSTSPAKDQGTFISGFHCAQSDDVNPNQASCRHWKGSAPDIGAYEFGISYASAEGASVTPPETIITQAPSAVVGTQKAMISFTGSDTDSATANLQYSYKLDSGPWSSWSSTTSTVFSKLTNGGHTFSVRSRDSSGNIDASAASTKFTVAYSPDIVMGNEAGASPSVYIVSKAGKITKQFFAFEKTFRGGVQVALGDFYGDGHNEIIVGSGPGRRGEVAIFTKDGRRLGVLAPFGIKYRDGVSVTAADIDADGIDELVMSRMKGKPDMLIYRFNGTRFTNMKVGALAYSSGVSGLSLASGDMDGDGTDEVVVAPAFSGDSIVRVFKFSRNKLYLWKVAPRAFRENISGGFTVATGNVRHDWRPDIVVMPKSSSPTRAQVLTMNASMKLTVSVRYYYPFGRQDASGGRIAIADIDGDRTEDVIAVKGHKVRQALLVFNGNTTKRIRTFRLFPASSRLVLSLASGVL